ncbi:unnamed protein product [Victoria cruziana]
MLLAVHAAFACPPRPFRAVFSCCGSEELREKLDSLYQESEKTRIRANNTRLRLMRLSEAAEKLRRQATLEVQAGNERAARDLLQQKNKVMEALEKSKDRIELLDKLSTKLSEAISMKENQLISNVAEDVGIEKEHPAASIWNIFPTEDVLQETNEHGESNPANITPENDREYELESNYQAVMGVSEEKINENDNGLEIMSSYAILEEEEKPKNPKVQTLLQLLKAVRNTRERLANALEVGREGVCEP